MSNRILHPGLPTFSFPTIFNGRGVAIAVALNEAHTGVYIDGEFVAQLALDEDRQSWFVAGGELNDPDLVEEIGARIRDRY